MAGPEAYEDGVVCPLDAAAGKVLSPPRQWDGKTSLVPAADGKHVFARKPNGTAYVLRLPTVK